MSKAYRIATLRVDVSQSDSIALRDVFGRVPVEELVEVLDSAWAQAQGWSTVEQGRLYRRRLDDEVVMEIEIGDGGEARMRLRASSTVSGYASTIQNESLAAQQRLRDRLQGQALRDEANLRCYEVVNEVYRLAIPRRARELQYTIVEENVVIDTHRPYIRMELKLLVPTGGRR
jgi:uncharacterized protein YaeQ